MLYKQIITAGINAALGLWLDVDTVNREDLDPSNYSGDGEAFHFDWVEGLQDLDVDRDLACEIYLSAFWAEIEHLQDS